MELTEEQQHVINYTGQHLIVKALAGCGKTTTLVQYAYAHPHLRILYLAYNRSIRDEATRKFPSNAKCRTSHQLAFREFGHSLKNKLTNNLRLRDIAESLDTTSWELATQVKDVLTDFMTSSSTTLGDTPDVPGAGKTPVAQKLPEVVACAWLVWERMIDRSDPFPCTHDTYLKEYQLSQPDLSTGYDMIMIDESQDTVPVLESIVLNQPGVRLLMCGDGAQSIYSFRNAVDSMQSPALQHAEVAYLTNSFRFGPKVAEVANALLALRGESVEVRGLAPSDCVIPRSYFSMKNSPSHRVTFLSRTLMGVLQVALFFASKSRRIYLIGGYAAYNLSALENIYWLSKGRKELIQDPRLKAEFKDYKQYKAMADESGDLEMLRAIKIIKAYPDLSRDLDKLKRMSVDTEGEADIVATTAHRSKGLEFDVVYLTDDFPNPFSRRLSAAARNEEINLLYVASTRAQKMLVANSSVSSVMRHAGMKGWRE